MTNQRRFRCAVYTRKSTEEGLDQSFNSLDAQRAACEAYVASQAGEGWQLIKTAYDDGGFSGGSMERPALLRLLHDIDVGRIDIVVVYKVDRLTRSLADFARIVERFDAKGASFVSVTQSFNTTTSMGRLTLNVLLSFAQFEREVTGERIRDKIAASKARGLWMGGNPMLGYDPAGRSLEINRIEAEHVRYIFNRYLELGSVHTLASDLAAKSIRAKAWITKKGKRAGGGVLARGALYHLLRNRHYLGEIVHKGKPHPGQHAAIIERDLFERVQQSLATNIHERRTRSERPGGSHLSQLVFDDRGNIMSASHSRGKAGKAHRYYVSKAIITGAKADAGSLGRVPARPLEALIDDRLTALAPDGSFTWAWARSIISRVIVGADKISVTLGEEVDAAGLLEAPPAGDAFDATSRTLTINARLGRRGGSMRMLDPSGRRVVDRPEPSPILIEALAKGWRWRSSLLSGAYANSSALAEAEGMTQTALHRYLRLAYLAPDLMREILEGRQRPGLSLDQLCRAELPLSWEAQRRLLSANVTG
ncbi:MAG: recombinase family protein [Hyphomonadaceae bacterium]|nr:recombinase family protein [Hyphomonadaceae bacterium]